MCANQPVFAGEGQLRHRAEGEKSSSRRSAAEAASLKSLLEAAVAEAASLEAQLKQAARQAALYTQVCTAT